MTHSEITILFFSLGLLLGLARLLGELAQRLRQPAILGEILAGILLGPTVLGSIAPGALSVLFPRSGNVPIALEAITTLAIVMFLLVAGMEVDLSRAFRQGRAALKVGFTSLVFPFAVGLLLGSAFPEQLGRPQQADPLAFTLFLATALSISALPVIAKILMDLNLYRTDFGILIVSAAVLNDMVGWLVFALILSLIGAAAAHAPPLEVTILLTGVFVILMLTLGRWVIHRILPWLQAFTAWPGGVLSFALTLALFGAAFAEYIGIHAVFGSFMVGVAVGDSSRLSERTRTIIDQFISSVFAPLFFASIGLRVDFAQNFDLWLVVAVTGISCISKILGSAAGARWADRPWKESFAVGFGMNARGAMEIILGLLALQAGIIGETLFVALILMALITSMISGPLVQRILGRSAPRRVAEFLSAKRFVQQLRSTDRMGVIRELTEVACQSLPVDAAFIEQEVWAREETLATGIGEGVAVPHARIEGITEPVVAVGISSQGVDFDAPDFDLAHVVFLILTPLDDDGAQLELISDIAETFKDREVWERMPPATFVEFLSLFKIAYGTRA